MTELRVKEQRDIQRILVRLALERGKQFETDHWTRPIEHEAQIDRVVATRMTKINVNASNAVPLVFYLFRLDTVKVGVNIAQQGHLRDVVVELAHQQATGLAVLLFEVDSIW